MKFGFSLSDAIRFGTANPARIMKYEHKGIISPGYDSDIIVFDKKFNIKFVLIDGQIKKNTFAK